MLTLNYVWQCIHQEGSYELNICCLIFSSRKRPWHWLNILNKANTKVNNVSAPMHSHSRFLNIELTLQKKMRKAKGGGGWILCLVKGFIKGQVLGKFIDCENDYSCLILPCRGKFFVQFRKLYPPVKPSGLPAENTINCYLTNRPQVSMVYMLINHEGCWKNMWRILLVFFQYHKWFISL